MVEIIRTRRLSNVFEIHRGTADVEQPSRNKWKGWWHSSKTTLCAGYTYFFKIFLNKIKKVTPFEQQASPTNFEYIHL